jgi:class III poly(R)-hydroxyalkanoic acid synthase PhaE subunit
MLSALAANPQGDALDAFRQLVQGRLDALRGLYAMAGQAFSTQHDLTSIAARWTQAPAMLFADALGPVSANLERAYGGLADAFGLAPARELREAAGAMATASLARRQAQAEYLALVGGALAAGAERLTERLGEMAQRGESVDSLLGLLRLWARATDEAMHQAMQDPKALEASAKLVRATTNARQQQQRVVAIVSHAINVPTRSEVDDAYREIQELKRELRRLRKRVAPTLAEPAADGAVADAAPKARPSRAAGRSGGRPGRGTNKKAVTA